MSTPFLLLIPSQLLRFYAAKKDFRFPRSLPSSTHNLVSAFTVFRSADIKSRASHILGESSTTELHPQCNYLRTFLTASLSSCPSHFCLHESTDSQVSKQKPDKSLMWGCEFILFLLKNHCHFNWLLGGSELAVYVYDLIS